MTQDIKDKIDEEAKKFAGISESKSVQNAREKKYRQAIEKGYSLASPKQDEQEAEIKRLKALIETAFNTFHMRGFPHNEPTFEQFQAEHNLSINSKR